ncbi:MAG: transposase [Planctomycetes bacterium]|nr:transposase [Planctomycetota bacterium]
MLAALRCSGSSPSFQTVHYSIQSNHLHLIVEARDRLALSAGMKGLLVRMARALNRVWNRRGSVFADRYHARSLDTPREVRNALVYVLHNSRKHGIHSKGIDPCSSGLWFDGWAERCGRAVEAAPDVRAPVPRGTLDRVRSTIPRSALPGRGALRQAQVLQSKRGKVKSPEALHSLEQAGDPPRARTWLLAVGWKRRGLIGPEEQPGSSDKNVLRRTSSRPAASARRA